MHHSRMGGNSVRPKVMPKIPVHIIKKDEEMEGGYPLQLPLPDITWREVKEIVEHKQETQLGTVITFSINGEEEVD